MHPYPFDSYFKNIGIQKMHDSSFERETHHTSSNKKLEKSTSCEQFCGCSKKKTRAIRHKKFINQQLNSTGFLETLRFGKRLIAQTKGHNFNPYLLKK
jgi:hypothetical protein